MEKAEIFSFPTFPTVLSGYFENTTIVVFPRRTSYVPTEELKYPFSKTVFFWGKLCVHSSTQGHFYDLFFVRGKLGVENLYDHD